MGLCFQITQLSVDDCNTIFPSSHYYDQHEKNDLFDIAKC